MEVVSVSYEFDVHYNTAPVMSDFNEMFAASGERFVLDANAFDFEGDILTFSDDTSLFDINAETGVIDFTPKKSDAGRHEITITVSDGTLEDSKVLALNIEALNSRPVIQVLNDANVFSEGETISIDFNAFDPDSDGLNVSIDFNRFTLSADKNSFIWETGFEDAGYYSTILTATDGNLSAAAGWNFTIINVNRAPQLEAFNPLENPAINEGEPIEFSVSASDPDNDAVSIAWRLNGINVADGNIYTFNSDYNSAGVYDVNVVADDGNAGTSHSWSLTVLDVPIACYSDSECGDSNSLTLEACANAGTPAAYCNYTAIACVSAPDCNDSDAYTSDRCVNGGTAASYCEFTPIACHSNPDCGDSNDYTLDSCLNAGTVDSYCDYQAIACITDLDCGVSGPEPATYCVGDIVFRGVISYYCGNTGTVESYCTASGAPQLVEECPYGCENGACLPYTPACGNGVLDAGEECDGSNVGGATCQDVGFDSGTLSCTSSCTVNISGCYNSTPADTTAPTITEFTVSNASTGEVCIDGSYLIGGGADPNACSDSTGSDPLVTFNVEVSATDASGIYLYRVTPSVGGVAREPYEDPDAPQGSRYSFEIDPSSDGSDCGNQVQIVAEVVDASENSNKAIQTKTFTATVGNGEGTIRAELDQQKV